MANRSPLFTVSTPFQIAPSVTLYDNTWYGHIVQRHPEMQGKIASLSTTLQKPTAVYDSAPTGSMNSKGYYMFVNHADLDQTGAPHVVCVNPSSLSTGQPEVATSYFDGRFFVGTPRFTRRWP